MKIFQINFDYDHYQYLQQDLDMSDFQATFTRTASLMRCQPITTPLTPPELYSVYIKHKRGDFWSLAGYNTFALPPASVEKVHPFLIEAGELIPVAYQDEVFSVLNILKCADCVDPKTKDFENLQPNYIADRVPFGIFREPNSPYMFVAERTGDPSSEFKACVEHKKMTGLIFREVWDSEVQRGD